MLIRSAELAQLFVSNVALAGEGPLGIFRTLLDPGTQ